MNPSPLEFYACDRVRRVERAAIDAGVTGMEMMSRAAAGSWQALLRRWPRARSLGVVCGPGNNGGDGYLLAALARDAGWPVRVEAVGTPALDSDASTACLRWRAVEAGESPPSIGDCDVVADALFGIGLSRAPAGDAAAAIERMNAARRGGAGVLALDVPSGLDADRGGAWGDVVGADLTVTFIAHKPGLYTAHGPDAAGEVVLAPLELPGAAWNDVSPVARGIGEQWLASKLPRRARTAHKGRHGHVLVIGGDLGMPGAALMAGRGALRAGAGLVSIATREAHAAALSAAQPELMCHGVEDSAALRSLLERADVVAVGPGLGRGEWGRRLWADAAAARSPVVVDADALGWLADNPTHREDWILTPHPGEAARLLDCDVPSVQRDRFDAADTLRERFGGVAVLKGAGTLVRGETRWLCAHGNPGMGTGGMGDVLTGLVAGCLAQGLDAEAAAVAGVWVHGLAADVAARRGERGLLPSDLLDAVGPFVNP